MKHNVLDSVIEGTDEPSYYNNYVGGKYYRPVQGGKPTPLEIYQVTFTDKRKLVIPNLKMFAKLNNYDKSHLWKVQQGKRKRHKDVVRVETMGNV